MPFSHVEKLSQKEDQVNKVCASGSKLRSVQWPFKIFCLVRLALP